MISKKNLTTEHVPPKSLFPKPRPSNLITVPSCESCNVRFAQDEVLFRLYCSATCDRKFQRTDSAKRIWKERVVPQSISGGKLNRKSLEQLRSNLFTSNLVLDG